MTRYLDRLQYNNCMTRIEKLLKNLEFFNLKAFWSAASDDQELRALAQPISVSFACYNVFNCSLLFYKSAVIRTSSKVIKLEIKSYMVYHIKTQNVNNVVCIAKITVICGKRFVVIKTVIVLTVLLLIATFSYMHILEY